MKFFFSSTLLIIYLAGSIQSSWILIDFYWNRDDYTEKYCQLLDEQITQCRAACYLNNLLEEQQNENSKAQIISNQKIKVNELLHDEEMQIQNSSRYQAQLVGYLADRYDFDFHQFIFHPPKV